MERKGELFTAPSEDVESWQFLLGEKEGEVVTGMDIKQKEINIIFASPDTSLADTFVALGIVKRENREGKDVLLLINPKTIVKF